MENPALFWLLFAASWAALGYFFWWFLRPSRRLHKVLGDGARAGLRLIRKNMPEWSYLPHQLDPLLGEFGKTYKVGLAYQFAGGEGYLLSAIEVSRRAGKREYRRRELVVRRVATGLDSKLSLYAKGGSIQTPPKFLEKFLAGVLPQGADLSACLPEFREKFLAFGEKAALPEPVQRTLLAAMDPNGFDLARRLKPALDIRLLPAGIVFPISFYKRPKRVDEVRRILDFVEELARGFRFQ